MENSKNIDALIESLQTENEALILVIEELVARLDEALDPVGKEDGDIDNDGDEDATDKYLLNRRKAIGKAIAKKKKVNEDVFDSPKSSAASRQNVKTATRLLGAKSPHTKALAKLHDRMKKSDRYFGISDDEHDRRMSDPEFQGKKPTLTPMAAKGFDGYDAAANFDKKVNLGVIRKAETATKKKKVNEDVETLVGIKVPARSTRKHMVQVANAISNLRPEERQAEHDKAAAYFRRANANFNPERFRKASGVSTGMHSDDYVKETAESGKLMTDLQEVSKKTKDAYIAKRGSQLQRMTTGLDHYRNLLTGKQQANAVKGIKRAMGIKEDTLLEKFKKVSSEIRHLMKDKGYPQKRAVAAALSMKRKGELEEETKDTGYDPRAAQAIANAYRERKKLKNKKK